MTTETLATPPAARPCGGWPMVCTASSGPRRFARPIRTELSALDDHLLRDMGFCRDQLAGAARDAALTLQREGLLRGPLFL